MADQKLTALTEDTSPSSSDYAYTVKDPGGTPLSRRATWLNILKGAALGILTTNGDLLTRTAGAAAAITRANLAADSAFTSAFAPLSVIQFSRPTNGATRASTTIGSLSTPWTDSITTTASLPGVKYDVAISGTNSGDNIYWVALACDGTIVDRAIVYPAGGGTRTNRGHLEGVDTPSTGAHTYEVLVGCSGTETIQSTVSTSTDGTILTSAGVSSMQLQLVATA